jgi:voltage-gated potassium channel
VVRQRDLEASERRLTRYEQTSALPMVGLALVFLALYATQVLVLSLPHHAKHALSLAQIVLWLFFAIDLLWRTWLAPKRFRYLASNPLDVAAVILPMFRTLRVVRVFAGGQWLLDRGSKLAVGRTAIAIVVGATSVAGIAALAMLDAERGAPGTHVHSFWDAAWWSVSTMSTVGYGDVYPVTAQGRIVGVALMVVGVSLLGVVTATVASWFIERTAEEAESREDHILAELQALSARVDTLTALIRTDRDPTG